MVGSGASVGSGAVLGTVHGDGAEAVRERVVADLGVAPSSFAATDLVVTNGYRVWQRSIPIGGNHFTKKLTKDLEERTQATDQEIASLEADREEKAGELAALSEKIEGRRQEIRSALGEIDETLGSGDSRREKLLSGLPSALRKRYQLLLDRRQGLAVVEARNGTCLGCNMQLPPQLFNSLFTAAEVKSCPHCNRLLYLGEVDENNMGK